MECKKCGTALRGEWLVCPNCGDRGQGLVTCRSCRHLIAFAEPLYCPYCGVHQGVPVRDLVYEPPPSRLLVIRDSLLFRQGAVDLIADSPSYTLPALLAILVLVFVESLYVLVISALDYGNAYEVLFIVLLRIPCFISVYSVSFRMLNLEKREPHVLRLVLIASVYRTLGILLKVLFWAYLSAFQQLAIMEIVDNVMGALVNLLIFVEFVLYAMRNLRMTSGAAIVLSLQLFLTTWWLTEGLGSYIHFFFG